MFRMNRNKSKGPTNKTPQPGGGSVASASVNNSTDKPASLSELKVTPILLPH